MATINLIYFGSVTDITGQTTETLEAPSNVEELNRLLLKRYPGLSEIHFRISVNRQLAAGERQLADGDEVALLPPFAGG